MKNIIIKYPIQTALVMSIIGSLISIFIGIKGFWSGYINASSFYITYIILKYE